MIEEKSVVLRDDLGVYVLLNAYTSRFHDGSTLKQMFDDAANGTLKLPATWGELTVTSRRVGPLEERQWVVEGRMAHCSDCGDEYSGPLNCCCFGQRSNFTPGNGRGVVTHHIAPCADIACPSRGRCLRYQPDAPAPVDFERKPGTPACTCQLDPVAEPHERLQYAEFVRRELGER